MKKTTKHTPGPWHIQDSPPHPMIVAQDGTYVARVHSHEWPRMHGRNATEVSNAIEEAKSNSALIASAPDLLAALRHALAALDDAKKLHPNWIYSDAQNAARSAIAKAERRTP